MILKHLSMNKMIKKFILISMLLLPSLYVRAQYSSVLAYDTYAAERGITIVRNMSSTEVVTYVSNTETQRFTYENNSTLVYKYFELPSPVFDKIIINDFRIINDVLYFCGTNNDSGKGVLGTFKVTELLNSVGTPVQIYYFDVLRTTDLNRIEAYIDPGTSNPRLAAVGYDRTGSCGSWACGVWVDCEGLMPGVAPTSLTVFGSYYSAPDAEQWFDVVSTDDWVVLVGCGYISGQQGIILRKFHKGYPTDPIINDIYFFQESETILEGGAVSLRTNDIAVAYRGVRNIDVSDFTKFRVFDIDRMLNINSQEYVVPYKSYLWELAYTETADRVVVLNDFPTPAFLSNFVYLIPYQSTGYTSVYAHDREWRFQSLTNLDGDFFVGSGVRPFHLLLRDATASYPAANIYSTTPVLCPEDNVLKVAIIDNITPNVIYYSLPDIPIPSSPLPVTDSINSATLSIRCLSN